MPLEFSKSTNSEHKEKLDSELVYYAWTAGSAFAGQKARFEIGTSFVGHGAPVKVTGKSAQGKKLGKVKGKIKANGFSGEFDIPEDIEIGDSISFKVELSKHGLSGESESIPVFPRVNVTNLKWDKQEARRGDILKITADVYGAEDGTEALVIIKEYDTDNIHDEIAEIPTTISSEKIELDWQYEYHEDTDDIPTDDELQEHGRNYNHPEYFVVVKIGSEEFGAAQESGLLQFKDWIEIKLVDGGDVPIKDEKYICHFADGTQKDGTLDSEGYARLEDIPPGPYRVEFPDLPYVEDGDDESEETDADLEDDDEDFAG